MITREQIPNVLEHAVCDAQGNKIGDAKHIFLDDASGRPEWASVKTGMFGGRESFVPIRDAHMVEDHLEVPFDKAKVKDAPAVDVDSGGHLSASEEHRLYDYYGVAWDTAWHEANQPGERGWAAGMAGTTGTAERGETAEEPSAGTGTTAGGRPSAMDLSAGTDTGAGMGVDKGAAMEERTAGMAEASGEAAMTLSEERLRIGKERRVTGRARLRKYVVTEQSEQTIPLKHEEVHVEHLPITEANRERAMSGPEITESQHEVTLHAERPVVDTETVPVERVRLTVEEHTDEETVRAEVRKERVEVEMPEHAENAEGEGGRGRE